MAILQKLIVFGPLILLVLLTALAGAVYSRIDHLSLPIPKALALFTAVLPLVSGFSTHGASLLVKRASKRDKALINIRLLVLLALQLIFETVVGTLALTHVIPPSGLLCGLNDRWADLWKDKNANAIKAIQDTLNCCGFNSVKDRAWPFSSNEPSKCDQIFGRTSSCVGVWRQAEQISAGLLLLVAVLVSLIKVLSLTSLLMSSHGARPLWANGDISSDERSVEDNRAEGRRLLEGRNSSVEFRDEADETQSRFIEATDDHTSTVEPSRLTEHHNAWRE